MLLTMSQNDDKASASRGNFREAGKQLEASTKDATLREMLVRQEVLSQFLRISPKVLSQGIPHVR